MTVSFVIFTIVGGLKLTTLGSDSMKYPGIYMKDIDKSTL